MLETILEGAAIVLIIIGFIYEDKLVAFEEKVAEKIKRRKDK